MRYRIAQVVLDKPLHPYITTFLRQFVNNCNFRRVAQLGSFGFGCFANAKFILEKLSEFDIIGVLWKKEFLYSSAVKTC